MAEQGPSIIFQHLEVPIHSFHNAVFELQECLPSSNTSLFVSVSAEAETSELLMLVLFYDREVGSVRLPWCAPSKPQGCVAILSL
jgi:hypothetical protein